MNCDARPKINYYEILNVKVDATTDEIRTAYKHMALIYHPDRNFEKINKEEYETKFKQLSDAYQILSNDDSRKKYDLDNCLTDIDFDSPINIFSSIFEDIPEECINLSNKFVYELMTTPNNNSSNNFKTKFLNALPKTGYIFNIVSLLIQMFEDKNYEQTCDKTYDFFRKHNNNNNDNNNNNNIKSKEEYAHNITTINKIQKATSTLLKTPNISTTLYVKLEDIYNNEIKKIDINRIRKNEKNEYVKNKKTFIIPLNESNVIFPNEADELPEHKTGDIIINISPQFHPLFKKYKQHDLYIEINVSLYEYYYGVICSFMFLNGKIITIKSGKEIYKNDTQRIKQLGLLINGNDKEKDKDKENRGDLYVKFVLKLNDLNLKEDELTKRMLFNAFPPLNSHMDDLTIHDESTNKNNKKNYICSSMSSIASISTDDTSTFD